MSNAPDTEKTDAEAPKLHKVMLDKKGFVTAVYAPHDAAIPEDAIDISDHHLKAISQDLGLYVAIANANQVTSVKRYKPDLNEQRDIQKSIIKLEFQQALKAGSFTLSLGWPIDCRRTDGVDDIDDMMRLLRMAEAKALTNNDPVCATGIKGADNQHYHVTVGTLRDFIIPEMDAYRIGLIEKKWALDAKIKAASSVSAIKAVIWE